MKILIVTQYYWPEPFKINDLSEELANRGHEITVLTGFPNYPEGSLYQGYSGFFPKTEYYGKVKVIRIPLIPRGKNKSIKLVLNYLSFFINATLMAPFLVRGKFDKIFVYQLSPITSAIPAIFLKRLKKIPMVMWVTDLWPESLIATKAVSNKKILQAVSSLVKWIYQNTDKILVTSKGFIPRITKMGYPLSKISYWPQWAEPCFSDIEESSESQYKQNKKFFDPQLPQSGFRVMFAGNIGSAQDFETIIKSAEILRNQQHHHIHFVILGDGVMKSWAESEVAKLNLSNHFHFMGRKPVDSMPYYYNNAEVLLVSLTNDDLFSVTIPCKLQSYLASGKAVLASLNGEGAKIVNDWDAGMSCPASHPEKLAEVILAMSKLSPERLKEFGKNALNCYQQEFERTKLISILESEFLHF
ncbi:MAG: glycosyltransferase family 4 protein [Bacteriovoracaceae bacterium]|nr:glycosyltransferase family 4 protein [Bacteriovoracaceae bacterium]